MQQPFDRSKHVYRNDAFVELVKDAVRFFNGTPVHSLPPPEYFSGTGVYALYYTGTDPLYARYAELNRLSYDFPVYVGKAVPKELLMMPRVNPTSCSAGFVSTAEALKLAAGCICMIFPAALSSLSGKAPT